MWLVWLDPHFFSPQTVGGLASAGSVWPGDAHDGNGGPACASTEPFAAFDARAQCHKPRSFSFSNKWKKHVQIQHRRCFVFSSLLEVPALCLLPIGVAHQRLEGVRPKRSRSTTFPRKSARSWPQRGGARQTSRRRTARQLQLDRKYFMPPSLGFWPLEIHIIQHMSSADGKNIATFFIRSFGVHPPPPRPKGNVESKNSATRW